MTSWSDPAVASMSAFSCPTPWVAALISAAAAAAGVFELEIYSSLLYY